MMMRRKTCDRRERGGWREGDIHGRKLESGTAVQPLRNCKMKPFLSLLVRA
jgi:hypothetical protein